MKQLFLLRHALALPADGGRDKDRALSPRGAEDAKALGALLERKGLKPDLILCSEARRTRETAEALNAGLGEGGAPTILRADLYDASRGALLAAIQAAPDDTQNLMILAHNPGIYELCAMMASEGPMNLLSRLDYGYPPCTLAVFDLRVSRWADIDPDESVLKELMGPADYNAPSPARWN